MKVTKIKVAIKSGVREWLLKISTETEFGT